MVSESMIKRVWMVAIGMATIAEGLVMVVSLGTFIPQWRSSASLADARYMCGRPYP